jgi:hypothetical protein
MLEHRNRVLNHVGERLLRAGLMIVCGGELLLLLLRARA